MAFDSYDTLVHPDEPTDYLCVPCAKRFATERGLPDPEDQTSNWQPVFNLTEVDKLPRCAMCKSPAEYCSFGGPAVDHGIGLLRQWLRDRVADADQLDYLDTYAEHLRWCNLGSGYEGAYNEIVVRRYKQIRSLPS
jgi:hypothetical protein